MEAQREAIYEEIKKLLKKLSPEKRRRLLEELAEEGKGGADIPPKRKSKEEVLKVVESLATDEIRRLDGKETVAWLREDRSR